MPRKKGSKFKLKVGQSIEPDRELQLEILDQWQEDMIWCPSQCSLTIKHCTIKYQIYLRWRHEDPWTCTLIRLGSTEEAQDGEWSDEDLFEKYGCFWTDNDSLSVIESSAIACIRQYLAAGFSPRKSNGSRRPRLPPTV